MDRLACPCCRIMGCTPELVMALEDLEKRHGHLLVSSGYRCDAHQATLRQAWMRGKIEWQRLNGGLKYPKPEPSLHSQHSTGLAIDVLCANDDQSNLIVAARESGFRGIGRYDGFVHLDLGVVRSW